MNNQEYFAINAVNFSSIKYLLYNTVPSIKTKSTEALNFGTAFHCKVLEPDLFKKRYFIDETCSVETMRDYLISNNIDIVDTKTGKKMTKPVLSPIYYNYKYGNDINFISQDDNALIDIMYSSACNPNQEVTLDATFSGGLAEQVFVCQDLEYNIKLKCKIDYIKNNTIIDLKTYTSREDAALEKQIFDTIFYRHYHTQLAYYSKIYTIATGKEINCLQIAMCDKRTGSFHLVTLDPEVVEIAFMMRNALLGKYIQNINQIHTNNAITFTNDLRLRYQAKDLNININNI